MPETARILRFPQRDRQELAPAEVLQEAHAFLSGQNEEDSGRLSNADVLFAICKLLRNQLEQHPQVTQDKASSLYHSIVDPSRTVGLFDEKDYLLGETALIAAKAARLAGRSSEAERWLDRADAGFRHAVNPAASLAGVAFERLAVRFATARYDDILDLLPSVASSLVKSGLDLEVAKCQFLKAVTLKMLGRMDDSNVALLEMEENPIVRTSPALYGQVLVHIGHHQVWERNFALAAETYERALPVVLSGNRPVAVCELKWAIGDTYQAQGDLVRALAAYRSSREAYQEVGFFGFAAQLHLVIAEVLLGLARPREAEWEILTALPTIESEKMVPEGFAAVALLRESVKLRKTDPNALRELRQELQQRT